MAKWLIFLLFMLIPFQVRFHGYMDKLSRRLTRPDFTLPEFFCKKIYLFPSDILIFLLVLLLILFYRVSFKKLFWEGPSKYLTLLFCVFLLSTWNSPSGNYALQYLRLIQFSFSFLLFYALGSMKNKTSLLLGVACVLMGCALLECGLGIWQYLSQNSLHLPFFKEENLHYFRFPYEGPLFTFGPHVSPLCRAAGTFSHPNILGGFLFASLMASYYLYSLKKHFLIGLSIAVQLLVLFLTFSRSAILAWVIATLIWAVLQIKNREGALVKRVGGILCASIICIFTLLYQPIFARGGVVNYNAVTKQADQERVAYMKVATNIVKKYPLLGAGFNHFQIDAYQQQAFFPQWVLFSKVHNIYLLIAAESGLIGIALFLLFLFSLLRNSFNFLALKEKSLLFSLFLGLLCIGACDFYLLENPHGALLFFGVAGILK